MPSGGKREGAGRPVGSVNKNRAKIVERLNALDYCPLQSMIEMLEEDGVTPELRFKIHEHVSNKIYPRLQPVEHRIFKISNGLNEPVNIFD